MNKKKIIMMSALLLVLVAVVVGITYAVYTFTGNSGLNTIDLGRISMSYTEPSNAYVLDNALPMTDEEGKGQNNYFEFTVTSHATTKESDSVGITIPYEINISDIAIDEGMLELSKSLMKVNLVKVDGMTENEVVVPTLMSSLSASTLNTGASVVYQANDTHKNGSTTITSKYRLRAWITTGFDVSDTDDTYQYKFRVNVNSNMDSLKPNVTEPTKLLRTAIMDQGVVNSGNGLYVSRETNDGRPTYYYHGFMVHNYVTLDGLTKNTCVYNNAEVLNNSFQPLTEDECVATTNLCDATSIGFGYFSGFTEEYCSGYGGEIITVTQSPTWQEANILWRVIRINEDNTIRLIADAHVESAFNPNDDEYKYVYYSESNVEGGIMKALNDWYDANLTAYDNKIATSTYCEQAKVNSEKIGNVEIVDEELYTSDFRCVPDANGYGLITDQKVGLINIDELFHAGAVSGTNQFNSHYLTGTYTWTMSPRTLQNEWGLLFLTLGSLPITNAEIFGTIVAGSPVINLNSDVEVTGSGTYASPWVITR